MAEQRTIRIFEPTDSKTYDVVLDETSRTLKTSASNSVAPIRDRILAAVANQFTSNEATIIAQVAVIKIQQGGLFI
ncbi:MAG: hypothetical protein AABY01_03700 [Nanoarchaeota archaeon]